MQKKSKKWQVTWANLSLVSFITFCKLLWERDTMETAEMDNTLLLPYGNFWSAIGDHWHGLSEFAGMREFMLDLPTLNWWPPILVTEWSGAVVEQEGNLMTSQGCASTFWWITGLFPTLKLTLDQRPPYNSRVCLWPEYRKSNEVWLAVLTHLEP